ncbi:MAG: amidohydrolase family protein [Actinomycetia bacterium]|nr:amidohydrolase family protein [Actinomycetes bacterium]
MSSDETPPPRQPAIDRRKFLLATAFGGTSIGLLRILGAGPQRPTSTVSSGATTILAPSTSTTLPPSNVAPPAMASAAPQPGAEHSYGIVLAGGRVIDPASGFDGLAHVGIDGDRVTAISLEPLSGVNQIDVTGLVVAPGFIDLLSYEPNEVGVWNKVADGVTTNMGMHGLNARATNFFRDYTGRVPVHFGGAFHDQFTRLRRELDIDDDATTDQIATMVAEMEEDVVAGFGGINFSPEYTPGTDLDEILALVEVAARYDLTAFFHARYSDPERNADAIAEVIEVARVGGVSVHVEHITSTGGTHTMEASLAQINEARASGIDITACLYPYDFWATNLASNRFNGDWQKRFGITYGDLQIGGTETRVTEETFAQVRDAGNLVAALGSIPEGEIELALREPWTFIGSDAILEPDANNHPRASGTFSRVLGRYVRDKGVLSLPDALAKMTILPAQRIEGPIRAMRRKGRLQRGADADITIFDPTTVTDTATVADPGSPSSGVEWVLVAGQIVKRPEGVQRDVLPGQALTTEL